MGKYEVRISRKCEQCGVELKESDKKCPNCGSNSMYAVQAGGTLPTQGSLNREHVAPWTSKDWAILSVILAIILFLLYLAYELLPLSSELKIAISIVIVLALAFAIYWQSYHVRMFIRWLDRKFTARKTYRDR
ncbi:MAG: hypothetical protein A2Z77_06520 [Chloroflexi bacterium RBG_13_51_36]|nr:MAG: hypothetical protein A2Z77_06520 [Chloroflexi bacterium RBG_13_51_36]